MTDWAEARLTSLDESHCVLLYHFFVLLSVSSLPSQEWSACDPFCNGVQTRERNVTTHAAFGGVPCGQSLEDRIGTVCAVVVRCPSYDCEDQSCSNFCVDCTWSDWGTWSTCTLSCGGGTARSSECFEGRRLCRPVLRLGSSSSQAQRSRAIETPKQGGGQCTGTGMEEKTCNDEDGDKETAGEPGAASFRLFRSALWIASSPLGLLGPAASPTAKARAVQVTDRRESEPALPGRNADALPKCYAGSFLWRQVLQRRGG